MYGVRFKRNLWEVTYTACLAPSPMVRFGSFGLEIRFIASRVNSPMGAALLRLKFLPDRSNSSNPSRSFLISAKQKRAISRSPASFSPPESIASSHFPRESSRP